MPWTPTVMKARHDLTHALPGYENSRQLRVGVSSPHNVLQVARSTAAQPGADARPAGGNSAAEAAPHVRSSRQAEEPHADRLLSIACQQDERRSNQENDPFEALSAEGDKDSAFL